MKHNAEQSIRRRLTFALAATMLLLFLPTAWSQTSASANGASATVESSAESASQTDVNKNNDTIEKTADKDNKVTTESKTTSSNKDPLSSSGDERFIPTEEISEDMPVSFPVDI